MGDGTHPSMDESGPAPLESTALVNVSGAQGTQVGKGNVQVNVWLRQSIEPTSALTGESPDQPIWMHANSRADGGEPTSREFSRDLTTLLRKLDEQARVGRLPPYLPSGADVADLARMVRIRPGVRSGKLARRSDMVPDGAEPEAEESAGEAYGLPADRREDSMPAQGWAGRSSRTPAVDGLGRSRAGQIMADPY